MKPTMTAVADTVSSIFAPVSTPAAKEADLARMVLILSAVVFVVVGGLIAYSVVRFRTRAGEQGSEPPQVYGSAQVEAAWTAVPLIIVLVLMLATGRVIHEIQAAPAAAQRGRGHGRRAAMVVGDPLSQARRGHRQRAACPGQ